MTNREHLHRHAVHALEDFDVIRNELLSYPGCSVEMAQQLHALSHHLRHTVYRSGIEVNRHVPVRRSQSV